MHLLSVYYVDLFKYLRTRHLVSLCISMQSTKSYCRTTTTVEKSKSQKSDGQTNINNKVAAHKIIQYIIKMQNFDQIRLNGEKKNTWYGYS